MKKFIFITSIFISASLFLAGCAGTEKAFKAVKSVHNDTSIKAVNALAIQLSNNRPDAAWYRMNEEYRISVSEKQFVENWTKACEGLGEITGKKDAVLISDGTYQVITVPVTFEKGTIFATFTVPAETVNPLDVKFSSEVPEIRNLTDPLSEPALKEMCKDYFKIGCGITGGSTMDSAVKSP